MKIYSIVYVVTIYSTYKCNIVFYAIFELVNAGAVDSYVRLFMFIQNYIYNALLQLVLKFISFICACCGITKIVSL